MFTKCDHDLSFGLRLMLASVHTLLQNAEKFDWELWKTGMLRLDLSPLVSLHVWDMRYREQGVTLTHDHPWHLHSLVVAGELCNQRYFPAAKDDGEVSFEYKKQRITCGADACTLSEAELVRLFKAKPEFVRPGQCYHQHKDEIHMTTAQDGTVTLVERTLQGDRDSAHVYTRSNAVWVDAEPRKALPSEVRTIAARALLWF